MKYRKKPVVIEAYQPYHGTMPDWFEKALCGGTILERAVRAGSDDEGGFDINTLEGKTHASPGDFIIRGVNGELYPCKPDIFEKTYDPVGDS